MPRYERAPKTHQEIRDRIDGMAILSPDDAEAELAAILHALNDRIGLELKDGAETMNKTE